MNSNEKLKFSNILEMHKIIAHKLALNEGEFATTNRYVTSKNNKYITIEPKKIQTANREFNKLVFYLNEEKNEISKKEKIINFFIKEIIEQWFCDGNKRTALLVANKLLIDYTSSEKKINLLISFDNKTFNNLLSECYIDKYLKNNKSKLNKKQLGNYLLECIESFDKKELENSETIIKSQFDSLSNIYIKTNKSLENIDNKINKFDQIVVFEIDGLEMETYELDDFLKLINKKDISKIKFIENESDKELLNKIKKHLSKYK